MAGVSDRQFLPLTLTFARRLDVFPMTLARRLLLRASRSVWLAEQLRRRAFFRRAVRRFMPGEDVDAALGAAVEFARTGIGTVLTQLGEQVTTPAAAAGGGTRSEGDK